MQDYMDKNQNAVSVFDKMAQSYQSKFMDVSMYHDSFDVFCDNIEKENAHVLELACGPGNITQYLLYKRPDLHILGTDLAPNMIELAKINNPTATFRVFDCREINSLTQIYDAVMCGFCFPYLSKEEVIKLIKDISHQLQIGGVLYISTMEDDYSNSTFKKGSGGDEIFMHYHEANYLKQTLRDNGLYVVHMQRKKYPSADGTITTDLILVAKKTTIKN